MIVRLEDGPADTGRRRFLGAASSLAGMLGTPALAQVAGLAAAPEGAFDPVAVAADFWARPRTVWLRRPATGEEIRTTWWADGRVIQPEYERLCWFLRDASLAARIEELRRAGRPVPAGWYPAIGVSYVTLDILYATNGWLEWFGMSRPLVVTSFFRHPVTNAITEGAGPQQPPPGGRRWRHRCARRAGFARVGLWRLASRRRRRLLPGQKVHARG